MGSENRANTLKRLLWLLDTIYKAGPKGIKRESVSEKWCKYKGLPKGGEYAEKTFHNHIEDIGQVFKIEINRTGHRYHIKSFDNNLELSALSIWMDYMTVKDTIGNNKHLRDRVLIGAVSGGSEWIEPILTAMDASVEMIVKYRKSHYTVCPYFLRLYRQRWYIIGHCAKLNGMHIFSLDKISVQAPTDNIFEMPVIDKTKYHNDAEFLKMLNQQNKK